MVRITPADVGRRVSVRSRIPAAPGDPSTTDTLGHLRSWADGTLEIERRDGSITRLSEDDLVAGRLIPPPPARRPHQASPANSLDENHQAEVVRVDGRAAATDRSVAGRAWRAAVAVAANGLGLVPGVRLQFTLTPGRWVDLDSLVEVAVAGLRDAGIVDRRNLDALVATKSEGDVPGLCLECMNPQVLAAQAPPGPRTLEVAVPDVPRPGRTAAKRALRTTLAEAHGPRPPLTGPVWADVALRGPGSLLGPMEPVLDTLEPVLGRDPRGQPRQEFFPNDDRIVWLRLTRSESGPALRLAVGPIAGGEAPAP